MDAVTAVSLHGAIASDAAWLTWSGWHGQLVVRARSARGPRHKWV